MQAKSLQLATALSLLFLVSSPVAGSAPAKDVAERLCIQMTKEHRADMASFCKAVKENIADGWRYLTASSDKKDVWFTKPSVRGDLMWTLIEHPNPGKSKVKSEEDLYLVECGTGSARQVQGVKYSQHGGKGDLIESDIEEGIQIFARPDTVIGAVIEVTCAAGGQKEWQTTEYLERVAFLRKKMASGEVITISAKVTQGGGEPTKALPPGIAVRLEGRQTWWRSNSDVFIHISNPTSFEIAGVGIEFREHSCAEGNAMQRRFLNFSEPIPSGQAFTVRFKADAITDGCLNIVEAWQ